MGTTFRIGDMTIHRIIEQEAPLFDPFTFLPDLKPEVLEENRGWMEELGALDRASGNLTLCIQSYVVRTPHHNVMVDTCVGNHKSRPTRPFWHQMTHERWTGGLAATGLTPADIDYVMCTHLHVDHVGWNTKLENGRWVPTFPRARYLFAEQELNYWMAEHQREPNEVIADSVIPVLEAGRAELVKDSHALGDHLRLTPTPGHTPGHVAVEIGKGRTEAVLTGDLVHSPLQMRYPEIGMRADTDRALGAVTRRQFFECHCAANTLLCTGHFPSPSRGRLARWGEGFRFQAEAA